MRRGGLRCPLVGTSQPPSQSARHLPGTLREESGTMGLELLAAAYTRWRFDQHFSRNTHSPRKRPPPRAAARTRSQNDHRRKSQHALGPKTTAAAGRSTHSAPKRPRRGRLRPTRRPPVSPPPRPRPQASPWRLTFGYLLACRRWQLYDTSTGSERWPRKVVDQHGDRGAW